ncbi:MAG: hypothetical protein COA96_08280 [SAR86 cluster bacterium]|uniref:DUF2306 domain-containing protein n=1 Tax=SAR86 cluster bacterium TaxID=2030880 RepID=A0A2A5B0V9_9GAMM|nr:MAG: hypothetical protein COA96_08280 [SAR86 cluster bacterium]
MLAIHQFALYLHIAIGSCALIVFWIPVFTRKGNLNHKRFGRLFAYVMYIVSFSGIIMSSSDLLFPVAMHAPGLDLTSAEASSVAIEVRGFALFLLSLSILVLNSTRQGWLTILNRDDRSALRKPLHIALNCSLIIIGLVLFVSGLRSGSILFMVFSVLQLVTGVNCLRYNFKEKLKPKEWWIQHLGGFIASGIGAYTAFFVFGGRSVMNSIFGDVYSDISIFLWVAPGVIGGIAIALTSRHYQNRFAGEWAIKHATVRSEMFS